MGMMTADQSGILILGAGGFAHEVAHLISQINESVDRGDHIDRLFSSQRISILGMLDDDPDVTDLRFPRLGGMSNLGDFMGASVVLGIGDAAVNQKLFERFRSEGIDLDSHEFPNLVHPTSVVAGGELRGVDHIEEKKTSVSGAASRADFGTALGRGNIIGHYSSISVRVRVGDFNIFNTRVNVGHDVSIGDFNVFSPNVMISGNVRIGSGCSFGVSSTVLEGVTVGDGARIGAGSVLMRDAEPGGFYFGTPAIRQDF